MRNFFKGSNEVPPTPETKVNNESTPTPEAVTPPEIVDLGAIEAEIAAIELANASAFDLERERIDKEEADIRSRESIVREITDMVKGNTELSKFTNESLEVKKLLKIARERLQEGGISQPENHRNWNEVDKARKYNFPTGWDLEKRRQLADARGAIREHEDFQVLSREHTQAYKLRYRINRLLDLPNLQSSTDLGLKKKELTSKIRDLEYKMEVLQEEGSVDLKKSFTVHETQQNEIAENPVAFAIETVRASNPEEFDRLFPDIEALKQEINKKWLI